MPGWLTAPLDRMRDILEGVYPATPVTGRSLAAGTFKATRLHGPLEDPAFPGAHFHRNFELFVEDSGDVEGDPPNLHAGSIRESAIVLVRVGYAYGRDAAGTGAGAGNALYTPSLTGHDDASKIREALSYPAFWGGLSQVTLVRLRAKERARSRILVPQQRMLVERRYELTCSYTPGTVFT